MAYKIQALREDRVYLDKPLRNGKSDIEVEKIQVTDRAVALTLGAELDYTPAGGLMLTQFGPASGLNGAPDINRNPYNFIALAGPDPWVDNPKSNLGHEDWRANAHSGRVRFTATARTPIFIPAGFPFVENPEDPKYEEMHTTPRHFFHMPRTNGGKPHYAIPGASFKGVLRSAVEALTNDRFGAVNREAYEKPLPYRRRSFQAGVIQQQNPDGSYQVDTVELVYLNAKDPRWASSLPGGAIPPVLSYSKTTQNYKNIADPGSGSRANAADVRPFTANLFNQLPKIGRGTPGHHQWTHVILEWRSSVKLAEKVAKTYVENLNHEHYGRHFKNSASTYRSLPPALHTILTRLADLSPGQLIFYTKSSAGDIDSFGKNVNYLWPAEHSVAGLTKGYIRNPEDPLGLDDGLGVGERLFGFLAKHNRDKNSQPFRGKVRIETLWGKPVPDTEPQPLCLAPLTAPMARAKSRPLYLEPDAAGRSSSYSDPKPVLRGRKFYWHQSPTPAGIWEGHRAGPSTEQIKTGYQEIKKQLPPPILPLEAGTEFTGCIHFDNLTSYELGALLYALVGDGDGKHALKAGKGKPRGLGSLQIVIDGLDLIDPRSYYASLNAAPPFVSEEKLKPEQKIGSLVAEFKNWCEFQSKFRTKQVTEFGQLSHIQDYIKLHTWPPDHKPRYYPINFSDYGWLPAENRNPDEPRQRTRNPAMKTARQS